MAVYTHWACVWSALRGWIPNAGACTRRPPAARLAESPDRIRRCNQHKCNSHRDLWRLMSPKTGDPVTRKARTNASWFMLVSNNANLYEDGGQILIGLDDPRLVYTRNFIIALHETYQPILNSKWVEMSERRAKTENDASGFELNIKIWGLLAVDVDKSHIHGMYGGENVGGTLDDTFTRFRHCYWGACCQEDGLVPAAER